MTLTQCSYCKFSYDEWSGDVRNGVPPGTPIGDLAGTVCSRCGLQGVRHERQYGALYAGLEAEYYDQFAGKAGIAFYKRLLESSGMTPRVLELGVGTGRLALELAESAERYHGVDWSPLMLKSAVAKRGRLFKEDAERRLTLTEGDILSFQTGERYSHVICPDGIWQHFTLMEDHVALLRKMASLLEEDGLLAIDLLLPPDDSRWESLHRKRVTPKKWVFRKVEGETSLVRQLYRCSIGYEVYAEGIMQSRYLVEREYALFTPKEMALLLALEGFELVEMAANYGDSSLWSTALPSSLSGMPQQLDAAETMEEALEAGKAVQPYRPGAWRNGGYPFNRAMPAPARGEAVTLTFIARKSQRANLE